MLITRLYLFLFIWSLKLMFSGAAGPPPVRNFTTITLYTDKRPWKEAVQICEAQGGRILDITYYSLYKIVMDFGIEAPWNTVPVIDGDPGWIGLHRRVTQSTDTFISQDCQEISNYKIVYWNTNDPYTEMDGDSDSFCVHTKIFSKTTTSVSHDFTRANCQDPKQFYCQKENGSCYFEKKPNSYGDTSEDYSTTNDKIYPLVSVDDCKELCLKAWSIFPHPDINVVEECWGFTFSNTECILHIVGAPSYFWRGTTNKIHADLSQVKDLYIKRCFSSAVNTDVISISADTSVDPTSTCGDILGRSKLRPFEVFVYSGTWTWNEAFITCNNSGQTMLQIQSTENLTAIQELVTKYKSIQSMDYIWLGLHVPDPFYHRNTWVWSDCNSPENTSWSLALQQSSNLSELALCSVLETATNLVYPVECNEYHYYVCMGDNGTNASYGNGIQNSLGSGNSFGPYNISETSCRKWCSENTFGDQECWGFAILEPPDVKSTTECIIYTINNTDQMLEGINAFQTYTLYTKMHWFDTFLDRSDSYKSESDLIPLSCCEVTGVTSECPTNTPPSYSNDISSPRKLEFILYRTLTTWNKAMSVCESIGATLAQPNDVIKWQMLKIHIESWISNGNMTNPVWIGLHQKNADDPCSLVWTGDCSRPNWTDFIDDESQTELNSKYCVMVGKDLKFEKRQCNKTMQFVCEKDAGPPEDTQFIATGCHTEIEGATIVVPNSLCSFIDCNYLISLGLTCLAEQETNQNECDLMIYIHTGYCFNDTSWPFGLDIVLDRKLLFLSSVNDSLMNITTGDNMFPKSSCGAVISDLQSDPCGLKASVTTTSLPSPISTSSSLGSTTKTSELTSDTPLTTSPRSTKSTGSTLISRTTSSTPTGSTSIFRTSSSTSTDSTSISRTSSSTPTDSTLISSSSESTIPPSNSTSTAIASVSTDSSSVSSSVPTDSVSSTLASTFTAANRSSVFTVPTSATSAATEVTTSRSYNATTLAPRPIYIWPCLCHTYNKTNMTHTEWEVWLAQTSVVDKYNTSRYRRRLNSVIDRRTSSFTIGCIAASVLAALGLSLIVADISRISKSVRIIHGNKVSATQQRNTEY